MTAADLPTTLESSACTTNVDGGPAAIGATGGTESEEEHDNEDINEKLREDAMLAATNPKPNPNPPPIKMLVSVPVQRCHFVWRLCLEA